MPTYIDESGDTGLVRRGGKPYFRLAGVWMPNFAEVEAFTRDAKSLRQLFGLCETYEFKFADTHSEPDIRRAYYRMAMQRSFYFAVSSIDKPTDYSITLSTQNQHMICATDLAASLRPVYFHAKLARHTTEKEKVIVDDNQDRSFLGAIKQQFRALKSDDGDPVAMVGKVMFGNSKSHDALQLADMICGAVGRMNDGKGNEWYQLICDRDLGVVRPI